MSFSFRHNPEHGAQSQRVSPPSAPFEIVVERRSLGGADWRPESYIRFGAGLRASGLLRALKGEDLATLLWLLSSVSPDGHVSPSLPELASVTGWAPLLVKARFERLAAARWQGQALVTGHKTESGLQIWSPVPGFLPFSDLGPGQNQSQTHPPLWGGFREEIVARNRATYARPRAEVEAQIEAFLTNGKVTPISPPTRANAKSSAENVNGEGINGELRRELVEVGLRTDQADWLLARYDQVRIRRQLAWLPRRRAKNRAGLLMAAVKDNYASPDA